MSAHLDRHQRAKAFLREWNDRFLVDDGAMGPNAYGAQCVNVANQWCKELGIEEFPGNADGFIFDSHPDCDWIENRPDNAPKSGAIVVFTGPPADPRFGHVAVCLWATPQTLVTIDQNWPDGSPVHKQGHIYSGVAGWFEPRCLEK